MEEHKKYKKTGLVIIIGALFVLIMHFYILSAVLFLIGLILSAYPFVKKNTNEISGSDIDDKCNCENCDFKGCNTNYTDRYSEVISNINDGENITNVLTENDTNSAIDENPSDFEVDTIYEDTTSEIDNSSEVDAISENTISEINNSSEVDAISEDNKNDDK